MRVTFLSAMFPRLRRARNQELLHLVGFVLGVVLLFGLWPTLDLTVSGWFYAGDGQFPAKQWAWVRTIYDYPKVGQWIVVAALLALLLGRFLPGRWRVTRSWRRRCLALLLAAALGVGWLVHDVVKEVSNRPRPNQTLGLGGEYAFVPMLRSGMQCGDCVSFVSGHAAGGFVYMAWGMWGAPATRRRWRRIGWFAGGVLGGVRILQGGHFLSDVLFSAVVMWLCCWLMRELWLRFARWRRWRKAGSEADAVVLPVVCNQAHTPSLSRRL
ncbi:phosphatase PAP2 family protein [Hylemonella gracilis]|uniref:Phosphatase PAP2 family protein n=1 Tax=Hylemonella gracilis TaxID=80880 RepID=A0A4P6UJS3_9BURK|nr:phosphatase PAP2 family protein [Hylemonella gracilis]QBK04694.1 phosphatase PAP2 family protein [Hylemonella gracilis]